MRNIRHVGLVVKSIENSLKFYCDLLGLKIQGSTNEDENFISDIIGIKNAQLKTLKLSADDNKTRIELVEFLSPTPNKVKKNNLNNFGLTHIALTVNNLDLIFKKLKKAGIYFNSIPKISVDGNLKVVFCKDFEGNFLELIEEL